MYWWRLLGAVVVAAASGFVVHVLYGRGWANDYVQNVAQTGRLNDVLQEPYPMWVVVVAAVTAVLPTLVKVLMFLLLRDKLPGRSAIVKGLCFGVLLLLAEDFGVRVPIMSLVIGNPWDVVLVQSLEGWLIYPAMGVLIALVAPKTLLPLKRPPNNSLHPTVLSPLARRQDRG